MKRAKPALLSLLLCRLLLQQALATGDAADFGGPDAVPNQIESDAEQSARSDRLDSWDQWKASLVEKHGLSLGMDYSAVYFRANEAFDDNTTSSGMLRFYGSWDLIGREGGNTGSFIWKVEHRHAYTDTAPNGYGLAEIGYVGVLAPPFSDQGARLTNLYWRQRFSDGRQALVAGFLDVTDFLDLYGMISPWLHFSNLAFSTGSGAIALPNDATLGAAFGSMIGDKMYLIASLVDANSDPGDPLEGFDTFFRDREYFKSIELGWTAAAGRIYLDNTHITLWQKDKQQESDIASGWGANFSFAKYIDEVWMPFIRAGYARDGGSLLEKTLAAGIGFQLRPGKDLLGVGFNWGRPNSDTFENGLDDQYTSEIFYRFAIGKRFTLTADLQHLKNPALNPDESTIWMLGARARVAF